MKAVTLPLITAQLESTTKMQKLTPLQQRIQAAYANDEPTKNQLLAQLYQSAQVNPLLGCAPALIQIPIFISLYRALTNLVAENKLAEAFLWIPDLQGPVFARPPSEAMDWIKSIFTGAPLLGWHDTLAFLSLPLILFLSQSVSQRVLQPPLDPKKVLTDQEKFSQGLLLYLPVIVAFFSINVPAGLAVYWIVNNLVVKSGIKDDGFPAEVAELMAKVDAAASVAQGSGAKRALDEIGVAKSGSGSGQLRRPKPEGFGNANGKPQKSAAATDNQYDTNTMSRGKSRVADVDSNQEKLEISKANSLSRTSSTVKNESIEEQNFNGISASENTESSITDGLL